MTTWAIGDLQGCYDEISRLLDAINFDPARYHLWFCGDLVNRGGQSLQTLRLVKSLDIHSEVVLGNHDLSLLAISLRREEDQARVNPDLREVLFAPDRTELLEWLRMRRL
ncbi:MAG: bis(5'-nucleosyl)-tetraphosphatase, partial [Gammaproteobacteria bacterium]|nr:bis(5'-nucleosyl)-tetraphosphatase [Gammaproteobacteria bacterium]